ncbi:hypothetical protein ACJJTC_011226 [Scirpophaga incertulas]
MEKLKVSIFILFAVIACSTSSTNMFGGRCSRRDPNVDACLLRSFNSLLEYLKGGAPEFDIEEIGLGDAPVPVDAVGTTHQRTRAIPLVGRTAAGASLRRRRLLGRIRRRES